ncbi:MAG: tRNA (adenosine(37)-N6)-dimethylallyltransferase MiaA [Planctomycetes bacterium]|nr:tRNA (adenosine(37)-N6)-dimethylallyltransferase MiaA [Planctomycetota bacterium]
MSQPLLFLVGSTASGKGRVALEVAERIGAEILSLDSMKVYRGMDVGTAKPSVVSQNRVRHRLIDVADPRVRFDVAQYVREAERALAATAATGRQPLFVGGTGLYLKAMLYGLFDGPPADPSLREKLIAEAGAVGPASLHRRLREQDPESAARLHPNDVRRVVRALEVLEKTGVPLSVQQREWTAATPRRDARIAGIRHDRATLYRRIDERVDRMFAAGLVGEVRGLAAIGALGPEASQAVGYREVLAHLRGEADLPATIAQVKRNTRHFAKRKETWWKHFPQIEWFDVGADDLQTLATRLTTYYRLSGSDPSRRKRE